MTSKWSIFEKPYLDDDSPRSMNLQIPSPDWPRIPELPPGFFPSEPSLWIFRFAPGMCWMIGLRELECGGTETFDLDMVLVPPGHGDFSYSAQSNEEGVRIVGIQKDSTNRSATVTIESDGIFSGTATICAQAVLTGTALKEVVVRSPFTGPTGILRWEKALALPPVFQVSTEYYHGRNYDCGCEEVKVDCCNDSEMSWSAGVVLIDQSDSVLVTITDSLGTGGPYSWSVDSGTGFSWASAVTSSPKNYLQTTATACGTAILTVTGCDGNSITGYAKCSAGQWSAAFTISGPTEGFDSCPKCCVGSGYYSTTTAQYKYFNDVNRIRFQDGTDICNLSTYCINDPVLCPDSTSCEVLANHTGTYSTTNVEVDMSDIFILFSSSWTHPNGCWGKDIFGQEWTCIP